jgi:hypothetical protein
MSVSNARPHASTRQALIRAQKLLEEVLRLIDTNADAPEIGARIMDLLEDLRAKIKSAP